MRIYQKRHCEIFAEMVRYRKKNLPATLSRKDAEGGRDMEKKIR